MRSFDGPYEFNRFLIENPEFEANNAVFEKFRMLCAVLLATSCSCNRKSYTQELEKIYRSLPRYLRKINQDKIKQIIQQDKIQIKLKNELVLEF